MRWIATTSLLAAACVAPTLPPAPAGAPTVVLLHGLGRGDGSMRSLGAHLARDGFHVVNVDYPSRHLPFDQLAEHLDHALQREVLPAREVHFVTHSAGGILARYYLAERPDFPVGRVVQLVPPNGGSELARRTACLRYWIGPLGAELAAGPDSTPAALPAPDFELGVIAGDRSVFPTSWIIAGRDDGIVSVAETRTAGMRDHLIVHRSHTWIMYSDEVQRQTAYFLRHGEFER